MRSTKIIKICSSSLCTCLHHMVILRTRNKITDFMMILAWASPFKEFSRFKTTIFFIIFEVNSFFFGILNLVFGTMNLNFGVTNLRNNEPSEHRTFGTTDLRNIEPSEQRTFGTMDLRKSDRSPCRTTLCQLSACLRF